MSAINATKLADALATMEEGDPRRSMVLEFFAEQEGVTVEELEAALAERAEKAAAREEARQRAEERRARAAQVEALVARVRAATTLAEAEALLPEVKKHGPSKGIYVSVDGGFDCNLKAKRSSGNPRGRPKADEPTGYVDSDGTPILGGFSTWVKAQDFNDATLAALKTEGGNWRPNAKMAEILLDKGIISVDEDSEARTNSAGG